MEGEEKESHRLLGEAARNADKAAWPAPAGRYLLGRLSADTLFRLATDINRMTEAHNYIGMNLLLSGKRKRALLHLRWAAEHGNKGIHEYRSPSPRSGAPAKLLTPLLLGPAHEARAPTCCGK